MARSQDNPHYQEDHRCGYCYEEWPCGGYGHYHDSGIHKWRREEQNRKWELERQASRQRAVQANTLLFRLGVPRDKLEINQDAVGQMVSCEVLHELIMRLALAEGIDINV